MYVNLLNTIERLAFSQVASLEVWAPDLYILTPGDKDGAHDPRATSCRDPDDHASHHDHGGAADLTKSDKAAQERRDAGSRIHVLL